MGKKNKTLFYPYARMGKKILKTLFLPIRRMGKKKI